MSNAPYAAVSPPALSPAAGRIPGRVSNPYLYTTSTCREQQEEEDQEEAQQLVAAELSGLQAFGIDARALEGDPPSPESPHIQEGEWVIVWIEIAEGPIRWIISSSLRTVCFVPDSRIRADFPEVGCGNSWMIFRRLSFPVSSNEGSSRQS